MLDSVKDYYGKTLQGSADLKTDACCTLEAPPDYLRDAMALIHPEVTARYYGCGLVVPPAVEGLKVLDLGCGAGRDAYLLSALVGEQGHVVGVDMTDEQLAVARAHMDYHREAFGYARGNVEFKQGYLEALETVDLEADSFDLIVSNCVINLCPDKAAVFREALRVLRPGGELYFSDVYADRRVPEALTQDPVLHGECLSGALYWRDFARLAEAAGFAPPRLIDSRRLGIEDAEVEEKVGDIGFYSAPTACSNWKRRRPRKRITAGAPLTAAPWHNTRTAFPWTASTISCAARPHRSAATPGRFCARAGSGNILTLSTAPGSTWAPLHPRLTSIRRQPRHPKRQAVAAAEPSRHAGRG